MRVRVTVSFEYDADVTEESYGTIDSVKALELDKANFTDDIDFLAQSMLDGENMQIQVEEVQS